MNRHTNAHTRAVFLGLQADIERMRNERNEFSTRLAGIAKDHAQWERDYKHELRAEIERLQRQLGEATARIETDGREIERLLAENDMMRSLLIDAPTKEERDAIFDRRFLSNEQADFTTKFRPGMKTK